MSDDNGRTMKLTRRRALAGLGVIGAASAGAGAGTMAYFSDTESSTGNTVSAGTLDLSSPANAQWTVSSLAPGETVSGSVDLTNSGSIAGEHLEIKTSYSESDGDTDAPDGSGADKTDKAFAKNLYIDSLNYGGGAFPIPLKQVAGAIVYADDDDSGATAEITETNSPPSGGPGNAIHISSDGASTTDYAISRVHVDSGDQDSLSSISTLEYQYYGVSGTGTVPDESYILVEDNGSNRLFGRHDSGSTDSAWHTHDLASKLGQGDWIEIDLGDLTTTSGVQPPQSATLKQVGVGVGWARENTSSSVLDSYFGGLNIAGSSYAFRASPPTLHDLSKITLDNLAGIASDSTQTRTFSGTFRLNPDVGNPFQGDGVSITFEFGLAQESGQSVL